MFDSFKTFISEFVDSEKHSRFAENDYRLVAASKGKSAIRRQTQIELWERAAEGCV